MITIQVTECELNKIIKSLENYKKKKVKRAEGWQRKKEAGLLIPVEVADAFITLDLNSANEILIPLIDRLECAKADLS